MTKAVIFDLGNTLINYHKGLLTDTEKDILGLWKMSEYFSSINEEIKFDWLYYEFYLPWISRFPDRKNQREEFYIVEHLANILSLPTNIIIQSLINFHEPSKRFAVCTQGVVNCLKRLNSQKIRLGILSNSAIPGVCHNQTLKSLDILDYFSFTIYSYDCKIRKPNNEIFELAIKNSKCKSEECVMIGDNYSLDISPAINNGIRAFLFSETAGNTEKSNNEIKSKSFEEILKEI